MRSLVLTADVAARISRALAEAAWSRIENAGQVDGNPLGVELRRWNDVVGTLASRPIWYYRYFNALKNVGPSDDVAVDEGLAWLRAHGVTCRITVSPFNSSESFLAGLSRRGMRPVQFMSVLCGAPDEDPTPPARGVAVRQLDENTFDAAWRRCT